MQSRAESKEEEVFLKKICVFFGLVLGFSCLAIPSVVAASNDPNFEDNPLLTDQMRFEMSPYLLPLDHPMKVTLDSIFSQSRVLENERTLVDAGFEIITGPTPYSFVMVTRHAAVPGYVFKMYLDSETRYRKKTPHWKWLLRRCIGAQRIRHIIRNENIGHFVVPDKWLYVLPVYPYSSSLKPEVVIVMETDMEPEGRKVSKHKWKTAITRKHLDELYCILKQKNGGHLHMANNVPFTKQGKFAFTDTEFLRSNYELKRVKKYLSKEMQVYWDSLIK